MLRKPDEGLSALARAAVDRADVVVDRENDENDQDAALSNEAGGAGVPAGGGVNGGTVGGEKSSSIAGEETSSDATAGDATAEALAAKVSDEDFVHEIGLDAGCGRPGGFGATTTTTATSEAAAAGKSVPKDGDASLGGEIRARGLMYHPLVGGCPS
jgi:hypothetical protein